MMWQVAHKIYAQNRGVSLEDLHAHVQLGFVRAATQFDPSQGWKFSTYAWASGWREAVAFVRLERAKGMHIPGHHPIQRLKVGEINQEFDAAEPEHREQEHERNFGDEFWETATKTLPARDRRIVLGVFRDGKMYKDLAVELGITKQRVQQLNVRAVERIKRDCGKQLELYLEAA